MKAEKGQAKPVLLRISSCPGGPTSSTRRRSSFCSSMRRCRWCSRCLMCASGSRCCCCCNCCCCCCFKASELLLFSCWSRRNSRRSVDSPGTFMMELNDCGKGIRRSEHVGGLSSLGSLPECLQLYWIPCQWAIPRAVDLSSLLSLFPV